MIKSFKRRYHFPHKGPNFLQIFRVGKIPFTVRDPVKIGNYTNGMFNTFCVDNIAQTVAGFGADNAWYWNFRASIFQIKQCLYLKVRDIRLFIRASDFHYIFLPIEFF